MAKIQNSVSFKGQFFVDTMEVHEIVDKKTLATEIYDLLKELRRFDQCEVSITIKEEFPVDPKNSKQENDEEDGE